MDCIEHTLKSHHYKLGSYIGKGATADCFHVTSSKFHKQIFVCKMISKLDEFGHVRNANVFKNEINVLSRLDHPGIIRCYDYFEDQYYFYIVLENCPGGTLCSHLGKDFQFVHQNFYRMITQILDAVEYIHNHSIVHLDIKPANIFFDSNYNLKISDFGHSQIVEPNTQLTKLAGSKCYMAPEVGVKPYDPFKADIYSLGVTILFIAKTVQKDRLREFPSFWHLAIDETKSLGEIGKVIRECLSLNPDERPTISELKKKILDLKQEHLTSTSLHVRGTKLSPCHKISRNSVKLSIPFPVMLSSRLCFRKITSTSPSSKGSISNTARV